MNRQPNTGPKQPEKPTKPQATTKAGKPRSSRIGAFFTMLRHKLFLVIISGVVVFAAAAAGAVITYNVQHDVWEQKLRREDQQRLLDKRIELIERTVNLMGKSTAVIGQDRDYTRSFLTAMARTAQDPTKAVGIISKMLKESSEARCDIAQVHANFISLLALNDIFFGERTRTAVRALQEVDPWWEADSALKADLIEAIKTDFYDERLP
ncbi:MAG: hypothetical protein JSU77_10850 [Fidelibacterota bacterium]|nr:MAG: hypothetical protein JSU77_10850 [Candidatus Neomarinimicrobiota bacterium]